MSGLAGHTLYALLALHQARDWTPSIVPLLKRHQASYLAGAYIGSDIQVMPEAVCVDTGKEFGFGTVPATESPFTGGPVRPWYFEHGGSRYRPTDIHRLFYGRSHLVFGWPKETEGLKVSWDALADYAACVIKDWKSSNHADESGLAWIFGWLVHVVSDAMIKSKQPGLTMHLVDGLYTPRNRPIQDLFAFHQIGVAELKIDWQATFESMAQTPVEAVQLHYMRIRSLGPALPNAFPNGWDAQRQGLLEAILRENRRWLRQHTSDVLGEMKLETVAGKLMPSPQIRQWTRELDYTQIVNLAERAGIRDTLRQISQEVVNMFDHVLAEL